MHGTASFSNFPCTTHPPRAGKTLAFGLPALRHIQVQRERGVVTGKGPFVLVKAPTRELAQQICAVFEDAGAACGMRALCIFGGVPKGPQAKALARGVEVAVGTPGRVMDLMEGGALKLNVRCANTHHPPSPLLAFFSTRKARRGTRRFCLFAAPVSGE